MQLPYRFSSHPFVVHFVFNIMYLPTLTDFFKFIKMIADDTRSIRVTYLNVTLAVKCSLISCVFLLIAQTLHVSPT